MGVKKRNGDGSISKARRETLVRRKAPICSSLHRKNRRAENQAAIRADPISAAGFAACQSTEQEQLDEYSQILPCKRIRKLYIMQRQATCQTQRCHTDKNSAHWNHSTDSYQQEHTRCRGQRRRLLERDWIRINSKKRPDPRKARGNKICTGRISHRRNAISKPRIPWRRWARRGVKPTLDKLAKASKLSRTYRRAWLETA
eukprot:5048722-Amphidinium_carterae.1